MDTSTEERIKQAARKVFHQKGYAATRIFVARKNYLKS